MLSQTIILFGLTYNKYPGRGFLNTKYNDLLIGISSTIYNVFYKMGQCKTSMGFNVKKIVPIRVYSSAMKNTVYRIILVQIVDMSKQNYIIHTYYTYPILFDSCISYLVSQIP